MLRRNEGGTNLVGVFVRVSRFGLATALLLFSCYFCANTRAQDISGGAGEGVKRPAESTTRKRPKTSTTTKGTKRTGQSSSKGSSQSKADVTKQVDAALELGNAARDSNPPRYADAEQAYRLAIGLDPDDARAYVGLGNTYYDQKHYSEAVSAFNRAIALDPKDAGALVALAYANNAQELYADAERSALRAIAIDPNQYAAYTAIGYSKYRRKEYQEAETAFRRAIALSPRTAETYSDLSLVLVDQGRWRDAESILSQAVTLDPSNASNLAYYGVVLQKLGQVVKAADTYTQAIKLDPRMTTPHSNLALIQYTLGDFAKAREEWNAALTLNSTYALDRVGLLILDRKLSDAQVELDKFTQTNPADEDGWLLLGDVLRMQRDTPGSKAAYARAAQIAPEYAQHARPVLPEPAVAKASPPASAKSDGKDAAHPTGNAGNVIRDAPLQQTGETKQPTLRYASSVRTIRPSNDARPTPASGAISVKTNANAVVLIEFVGGGEAQMSVVPASLTVVAFRQLRPGEYRVAAALDGFEPVETTVFVAVTKVVSITLTLRPKS